MILVNQYNKIEYIIKTDKIDSENRATNGSKTFTSLQVRHQ